MVVFPCPLWLESLRRMNLRTGSDMEKGIIELLQREKWMRPGRMAEGTCNWDHYESAFFPCNISGAHWVTIQASRNDRILAVLDSRISQGTIEGDIVSKSIESLQWYLMHRKSEHWSGHYKWIGYDMKFPQQENDNDCGVFCLIACRHASLGLWFLFSQRAVPAYRRRFVHELLVGRAS